MYSSLLNPNIISKFMLLTTRIKCFPGDPKYGVPNLDPLAIKELKVRQGTRQVGLNLTLSNCSLIGLKNAEFTDAR